MSLSPPSKTSKNRSKMDSSSSLNPVNNQPDNDAPDGQNKRKEVPDRSEASSKPKKRLNPRSDVWKSYTRTKENRDKCNCNYCKKIFACPTSSGTSNLQKHLQTCKQFKAYEERETQKIIDETGNVKSAKVSEAIFKEATEEMLVIGELPLSFVESMAWKHFCNKVQLYTPHSRRTAGRNIVEMYVQRKRSMKEWFKANKQRVSLTTDIWVCPPTGASYMVITCHYIDENWKLKKLIIGFKNVIDHKGQTISDVLLECLADWGIEKIFCITVDNATATTSALRRFHTSFADTYDNAFVLDESYMHVRCSAHIINLIVKEGLAEVGGSVAAVRNGITYVRSSTPRLKSFELRVDSGKLTRGSLPLDIKTRWNSTFTMLNRAIKFRLAFEKMETEDKLYNDYFVEFENGAKRIGPATRSDWSAIERLERFLIIFYNSILVVSASSSLNSFKCYGEIVAIEKNLMNLMSSLDSELRKKAEEMLKKFDKYWEGMKGINKMLIIATIFDPRKKMKFARMCWDKLYGKNSLEGIEMNQLVLDVLRGMFDEYKARFGTEPNMSSSQSGQSSSRYGIG